MKRRRVSNEIFLRRCNAIYINMLRLEGESINKPSACPETRIASLIREERSKA